MQKNKKSLLVFLLIVFLLSALVGAQFIGKVSASEYTEYVGTLNGAQFVATFPDNWNRMLVVLCRGYSPSGVSDVRNTMIWGSASGILSKGFAIAGSTYGSGGFCIQKGVNSTYELTLYIISTYNVTGKVFLYGMSMGGAVALLLGEKYPNIYSGVLDMFGTKDLKEQHTTKSRWANLSDTDLTAELTALNISAPPPGFSSLQALRNYVAADVPAYELETGGTPTTQPTAYEDRSPTYHANITIPVITVHGTADTIVPFYESVMYQTAVANVGRSSLYHLYNVTGGWHTGGNVLNELPARFAELVAWSNTLTGSLTLTPATQAPEASVTVDGTGFGATNAVGIGFGAEANVTDEAVNATGPYDVDIGPYVFTVSYLPVKPGSFQMETGALVGDSLLYPFQYWDNGDGTISSTNPQVTWAIIDYATGKVSYNVTTPLSSSITYVRTVNYTRYEYNVTPAAGVTTNSSGAFTASITVPRVANGDYTVTAVDTQGNLATATLNTVPEGLTLGVMLTLSTIAMIASKRYFRKRAK